MVRVWWHHHRLWNVWNLGLNLGLTRRTSAANRGQHACNMAQHDLLLLPGFWLPISNQKHQRSQLHTSQLSISLDVSNGTVLRSMLLAAGFTCSAGIAGNKLLAKIASAMNKPNQQTLVPSRCSFGLLWKHLPPVAGSSACLGHFTSAARSLD